jgi:SAM-dependent methyltransferase
MKLSEIVRRKPPEPWSGSDKIPWNDPGFSARMLREHLSQDHDAASRRSEIIDRHIHWIHHHVLGERPSRVLDLGCGPGLYTSRLARLGHRCVGIDFSPASIDHARADSEREGLVCEYLLRDLREGDFGGGFDLLLLISGELNTFSPADARVLLLNAAAALVSGGVLLLEIHTQEAVRETGHQPRTWYSRRSGLFSDSPHVCLKEASWNASEHVAVERYFVLDTRSADVTLFTSTLQAYSREGYHDLVSGAGFVDIVRWPGLEGRPTPGQEELFALTARKS